jgi:pimeloyl-ACP methyl ester carboxylesterase
MNTQYVKLTDIDIAYCENGTGRNLILLHGNSESKSIFKKYQKKFFMSFHSYALDSRGHGESISTDSEYSINQYSDDVIKFCEKLGITESYIIGYSDGGNIALFLGKKRPDLFPKIVAISPNYLVSGTTDSALRLITTINNLFIILRTVKINTTKWIMRFQLMLKDIGLSKEELKEIKTSIMFLYAERDMIKEEHVREMADLIPLSIIKKIGSCSHISIINKIDTIIEIVKYFRD